MRVIVPLHLGNDLLLPSHPSGAVAAIPAMPPSIAKACAHPRERIPFTTHNAEANILPSNSLDGARNDLHLM